MNRKIKAWLCGVLALALLIAPMPLAAEAGEWIAFGDFYGTVRINTNTNRQYVCVTAYTGSENAVTVPAEVDGVPVEYIENLGEHCPERLTIPDSVRVIRGLFADMSSLRQLELPGSRALLYAGALSGSEELTISVPEGDMALSNWSLLPEGVTIFVEQGTRLAKQKAFGITQYESAVQLIAHAHTVGDVDADGMCTSTDARRILQHTANKAMLLPEEQAVADVDGDGAITSTDARLALQYTVGKVEVPRITVPASRKGLPFLDAASVRSARFFRETGKIGLGFTTLRDETVTDPAIIAQWVESFNEMMSEVALNENFSNIQVKPDISKTFTNFSLTFQTDEGEIRVSYYYGWRQQLTFYNERYFCGLASTLMLKHSDSYGWNAWSKWLSAM